MLGLGGLLYLGWQDVGRVSRWLIGAAQSLQQTVAPAPQQPALELAVVKSETVMEDSTPVLIIDGRIMNKSPNEVQLPPTIVTLHDDSGAIIQQIPVTLPVQSLMSGDVVSFTERLPNPPEAARDVRVMLRPPAP